jgi:hypothetical protein
MFLHPENDGAESSSKLARKRTVELGPFQLDAEHAPASRGRSSATQRPTVGNDHGRAANDVGQSSSEDTATGVGLRSASRALAPSPGY